MGRTVRGSSIGGGEGLSAVRTDPEVHRASRSKAAGAWCYLLPSVVLRMGWTCIPPPPLGASVDRSWDDLCRIFNFIPHSCKFTSINMNVFSQHLIRMAVQTLLYDCEN
jgi:hypothetical protein